MLLETFTHFPDFELLDSGNGYRLERWGQVILQRPDPQIIWQPSLPENEWNTAWAIYKASAGNEKGQWDIKKALPNPWIITYTDNSARYAHPLKFSLKLSPFKHTGLFAEQAANWEWALSKLDELQVKSKKLKILNLFAYTGGATMVLVKAGCEVTHVDASKPAITWANENHKLNNLPKDSVRWILDDAVKFVKREFKRGVKYDGIIMDPPAFGHSPTGKTWKFNIDIPTFIHDCMNVLAENAKFFIINAYATNSSALALNNLMEDAVKYRSGKIEFGELCLKQKTSPDSKVRAGRMISTGIFARWSS